MLHNQVYAEAVGYSFWQAYNSEIAIIRNEQQDSDQDKLTELKQLAAEFSQACEIADPSKKLSWDIPTDILDCIKQAATLKDCY